MVATLLDLVWWGINPGIAKVGIVEQVDGSAGGGRPSWVGAGVVRHWKSPLVWITAGASQPLTCGSGCSVVAIGKKSRCDWVSSRVYCSCHRVCEFSHIWVSGQRMLVHQILER